MLGRRQSLLCGQAVPSERFRQVLFDTVAAQIEHTQIVLRPAIAFLGLGAEFPHRRGEVAAPVCADAGLGIGPGRAHEFRRGKDENKTPDGGESAVAPHGLGPNPLLSR